MALRAFHNNPGIGGFGESTPVLLDDITVGTHRKRNDRTTSSNGRDPVLGRHTSNRDNGASDASSMATSNVGNGDLLCQIVKELVDNAVDACRSPRCSDEAEYCNRCDDSPNTSEIKPKKRIRVDIRPPKEQRNRHGGLLQITVTDNGCGMENIQRCVDAFQTSKDGNQEASRSKAGKEKRNRNTNAKNNAGNDPGSLSSHTSGRYGIGLTLCLLHAQRCVPNSRSCISSATPRSKHRTRAFFEVDKQGDSVDCVQEEVSRSGSGSEGPESGTCGGKAAKVAWPRLCDYFTRFRLCPQLHFELDVFAPTLSKLPIFVRRLIVNPRATDQSTERSYCPSKNADPWEDLMDDENGEDDDHLADERKEQPKDDPNHTSTTTCQKKDLDRLAFFRAAKIYWPKRKIEYQNVARSVHNISNRGHVPLDGKEREKNHSELKIEICMVVCPHHRQDQNLASSIDSAHNSASTGDEVSETDAFAVQDHTASLQLVRMVNGVPILDSAEAHSCGLVHGLANKIVWGSFGLDIERNTTVASDATALDPSDVSSCTPRFHLRDSNLITPFIRRNLNHKQLKADDQQTIGGDCLPVEEKKKRKMDMLSQNDILPANVRIGSMLVVVHIRAAPSSLPLPTLSKGRLPLNHEPIDSALQRGLRECLSSLQSTNPTLLLTTTQLRAVEREVRFIPGIASAVSRIVCRSSNEVLRRKSLGIFQNVGCVDKDCDSESSTIEEELHCGREDLKVGASSLATAFESRLRLAMRIKNEAMNAKNRRSKKKRGTVATDRDMDKEEEYLDFDSDDETYSITKLPRCSPVDSKPGSISLCSLSGEPDHRLLETDSDVSFKSLVPVPRHRTDAGAKKELPLSEIVVGDWCNRAVKGDRDEDGFDDWW